MKYLIITLWCFISCSSAFSKNLGNTYLEQQGVPSTISTVTDLKYLSLVMVNIADENINDLPTINANSKNCAFERYFSESTIENIISSSKTYQVKQLALMNTKDKLGGFIGLYVRNRTHYKEELFRLSLLQYYCVLRSLELMSENKNLESLTPEFLSSVYEITLQETQLIVHQISGLGLTAPSNSQAKIWAKALQYHMQKILSLDLFNSKDQLENEYRKIVGILNS